MIYTIHNSLYLPQTIQDVQLSNCFLMPSSLFSHDAQAFWLSPCQWIYMYKIDYNCGQLKQVNCQTFMQLMNNRLCEPNSIILIRNELRAWWLYGIKSLYQAELAPDALYFMSWNMQDRNGQCCQVDRLLLTSYPILNSYPQFTMACNDGQYVYST